MQRESPWYPLAGPVQGWPPSMAASGTSRFEPEVSVGEPDPLLQATAEAMTARSAAGRTVLPAWISGRIVAACATTSFEESEPVFIGTSGNTVRGSIRTSSQTYPVQMLGIA